MWYAVMRDHEDADWGTGSESLDEAMEMAKAMGAEYIAVIDGSGNSAVCVEEVPVKC